MPSWLLESSAEQPGKADQGAGPQHDSEPDEDGVQHFDVTPEPSKRRLSMTPPGSRRAHARRISCPCSADGSATHVQAQLSRQPALPVPRGTCLICSCIKRRTGKTGAGRGCCPS